MVSEPTQSDLQLLKAGMGRIERDVDRLDRKLDAFLTAHAAKHDAESASMNLHLREAGESMNRSMRHDGEILNVDKRVEAIETWRHELLGAMGLIKITFGASIISSIIAIASLLALVGGLR